MNPAWRKTQRGRVVYNDKPKPFRQSDAARILRSVLDFDIHLDDDSQSYRFYKFCFDYGFLPINLNVIEKTTRVPLNEIQQAILGVVNGFADSLGVPELAQTIADGIGEQLYDLVVPPVKEYALPSALVEIIERARKTSEEEGRGHTWLLKGAMRESK